MAERKPLPNASMKPKDKEMLEKLTAAIAGATGDDKDDLTKTYLEKAQKESAGAALDAAFEEYAKQIKDGKVKVADKAAVDRVLKDQPLQQGRMNAATEKVTGDKVPPKGREKPLPVADMKPVEKELLDKLVAATAKGTGEDKADILAPTDGKTAPEKLRNAMAQYAIAAADGKIADADKVKAGPLQEKDLDAALKAATVMKAMPRGVKDNMTPDDTRKAVILAVKDPDKFKAFVEEVKKAGPNRGEQKKAAENLKDVIKTESIAMAIPEGAKFALGTGGDYTRTAKLKSTPMDAAKFAASKAPDGLA